MKSMVLVSMGSFESLCVSSNVVLLILNLSSSSLSVLIFVLSLSRL